MVDTKGLADDPGAIATQVLADERGVIATQALADDARLISSRGVLRRTSSRRNHLARRNGAGVPRARARRAHAPRAPTSDRYSSLTRNGPSGTSMRTRPSSMTTG